MGQTARRPLVNADLLRMRWLDQPRLSADGRRLAYTETWLDDARDEQRTAVVVDGRQQDGQLPAWAPDGSALAYASGEAIFRWTADAAAPVRLAGLGAPVEALVWSPGGDGLAALAGGRLWRVPAQPGPAVALAPTLTALTGLVALGDGSWCVVQPAAGGASSALWRVRADAAPEPLLHFGGPIRAVAAAPDVSALAFIAHAQGVAPGANFGVHVLDLRAGQVRELTAGWDHCVGLSTRSDDLRGIAPPELVWVGAGDAARLYFLFADGGASHVARVGLSGRPQPISSGLSASLAFDVAAGADVLAVVVATALDPGEVVLCDRDGAGARHVTAANAGWRAEVTLSAHQPLEVVAGDGTRPQAWLLRPPHLRPGERAPLLVEIHGGPHYALGERFSFEFQRLAARGYAVLFTNPRGSQGYGEDYATAIRGAWGGLDAQDVLAAIEAACALPWIDAGRVALTGVSYGAWLTHVLIGRSDRFRAAVTENGLSDLRLNFASTQNQAFWVWEMRGTPDEVPERYAALSPVARADDIHTPLLMIHAEQDVNCVIAQSEVLHEALRARGRTSALVRIPGEGHLMNLLGTPRHRAQRTEALDAWLARHL